MAYVGDREGPLTTSRRIPALALTALILFALVGGGLAWRQYNQEKSATLTDVHNRAVIAAAVFNTYFAGEISTLSSIADAPAVINQNESEMLAYFRRVQPKNGTLFTGGLSWIDAKGEARVSTNQNKIGALGNVTARDYYKSTITTGLPYVSAGLIAKLTQNEVIATAVPTHNAAGKVDGVLVGSLLIRKAQATPQANAKTVQALSLLGYTGVVILDRNNQSVLNEFKRPRSLVTVHEFNKIDGVLTDARGLNGRSGHVLAYAKSLVPGWTIVLDLPRSTIFASARRSLVIELALVAGMTLIGLLLMAVILARVRKEKREQADLARQRRLRYEQEHEVATTLQRSLLADLPEIDGIDSAARYQAGSSGLEVGGDWYDIVERPDGIVLVSTGDVAGHGIKAAALMGQLRNAFRAYALDHDSPLAILWRLIRHMGPDELATTVCITIDRDRHELLYGSAGHLPALLRDDETGTVIRLDMAQSPPLGITMPEILREVRLPLPPRATLLTYTDGVVERRDTVIDVGIERLEAALATMGPGLSADTVADRLIHEVAEVTAADDDVALLVMRITA